MASEDDHINWLNQDRRTSEDKFYTRIGCLIIVGSGIITFTLMGFGFWKILELAGIMK